MYTGAEVADPVVVAYLTCSRAVGAVGAAVGVAGAAGVHATRASRAISSPILIRQLRHWARGKSGPLGCRRTDRRRRRRMSWARRLAARTSPGRGPWVKNGRPVRRARA